MKSQFADHILLQNLVPVTSLTSIAESYILNCRCESKSQATISNYKNRLQCFAWFCQVKNYPDKPQELTTNHIRQFLSHLSTESNRWGSSSLSARRPASRATVNHYYRVLHSFFNWLYQEGFIAENPVGGIKTPKTEKKVIQALLKANSFHEP